MVYDYNTSMETCRQEDLELSPAWAKNKNRGGKINKESQVHQRVVVHTFNSELGKQRQVTL